MKDKNQQPLQDDQFEELSLEEQQEILEKYDLESNTRTLGGVLKYIIYYGLMAFSLFQLYTAIYGQFPAQIQRTVHLGFGLVFIFLLFPARRKFSKTKIPWYDFILTARALLIGTWITSSIACIRGF